MLGILAGIKITDSACEITVQGPKGWFPQAHWNMWPTVYGARPKVSTPGMPAQTQLGLPLCANGVTSPLVVAFGVGVDSVGMVVGYKQRGVVPDLILAADVGSEKDATYAYLPVIQEWLKNNGFPPVVLVRYQPKTTRFGHYSTLGENCIRNATLPSLAFGFKACSQKWKVAPQNQYCDSWEPALRAWGHGLKVRKAIGYDCGSKDSKRYAEAEGYEDPKYAYVYPLREWGWDRERCKEEIRREGLPVPPKSACYFCPSTKPEELKELPEHNLRAIVIIEARAKPYLRAIQGLWRNGVKGVRTGRPVPPRMTDYILSERLLPAADVHRLQKETPTQLDVDDGELKAFLQRELQGRSV